MIILKYIYIALGFLFFGIGAIGVVIPILPTTPFLLLASFCFAKGSARFNKWFKGTKIYKHHLESFEKSRAMTLKTKLCILIPVSIMLMIAFLMMHNVYGRASLILLVIVKYYYFFFKIKTIPSGKIRA
ncbi:MAG: YbaN family protein [Anaerotignaceae bacterium]